MHLFGVIKDVFDNMKTCEMEYRRNPLIRTVVIRTANYPDRLGLSFG
jgi:hypothetical protein